MVISPTNINHNIPLELYIKDIKLSKIHVYEYLGVHIDDMLTMGSHIEKTCTSVQKKYGILCKIQRYVSEETALLVYKVMIRPHFDYGDYMIDSGTQNNIDKLERIQDRILRTKEYKCVEKRENIDVLKARYAVEKLCVRRKRNLLKIMFNESHNDDNIDYYRPERVLRSEDKVKIK